MRRYVVLAVALYAAYMLFAGYVAGQTPPSPQGKFSALPTGVVMPTMAPHQPTSVATPAPVQLPPHTHPKPR